MKGSSVYVGSALFDPFKLRADYIPGSKSELTVLERGGAGAEGPFAFDVHRLPLCLVAPGEYATEVAGAPVEPNPRVEVQWLRIDSPTLSPLVLQISWWSVVEWQVMIAGVTA